MLCFAYYALLDASNVSIFQILPVLVLFLLATVGMGTLGHLFNDISDAEQDEKSGAESIVVGLSKRALQVKYGLVLFATILPWLWIPASPAVWLLLCLEVLAFYFYSAPPFRFKERGIWGALTDSLYAYTIPLGVTTLVFSEMTNTTSTMEFGLVVGVWTILLGFRGIMSHQLLDEGRDRATRVRTFVTTIGWGKAFELLKKALIVEAVLFVALLFQLWKVLPATPYVFGLFLAASIIRHRRSSIVSGLPSQDHIHEFCLIGETMSKFQNRWWPLLPLAVLVSRDTDLLALAFLHCLVFDNALRYLGIRLLGFLRSLRH